MARRGPRSKLASGALLCAALLALPVAAQQLDRAIQADRQVNVAAAQSQQRIDTLSDQTQDLLQRFRAVNQQIDTLKVYNKQLGELVASQEEEKAGMQEQIDQVSNIEREIRPLMAEMIDSLEQFVELDVPFLLNERRGRVERLRDIMTRSDVSASEAFRRLMEAYQIENDYGRAVDTYRDTLELEGGAREVDFLKIGRVAFLYLTLDGREAGVWNQATRTWQPANDYRDAVKKGLRMANKQAAFDLLTLPVPAPEPAR